jgi:hypothetical protein
MSSKRLNFIIHGKDEIMSALGRFLSGPSKLFAIGYYEKYLNLI